MTMEDVLAAHLPVYRWSSVDDRQGWACSTYGCDVLGDFETVIKHQAAELEAAGFGNQHDAWAEGRKSLREDLAGSPRYGFPGYEETPNPYPYPKVSES